MNPQEPTTGQNQQSDPAQPQSIPASQTSLPPNNKSSNKTITLFLVIIILIMCGGMLFYTFTKKSPSLANATPTLPISSQPSTPIITPTSVPTVAINNCGNASLIIPGGGLSYGITCFINATKTCNPATLTINAILNFNGTTRSTVLYKILGMQQEKCALQITQGAITQTFPTTVPQSQQQVIEQTQQKLVGRIGTCLFTKNADLTEIFSNWENGIFSSSTDLTQGDFRKGSCSGAYFTQN